MTMPQYVPNGFDLNIMYGSNALGPASLILSLTTNVLATSLIGYKTWCVLSLCASQISMFIISPREIKQGTQATFETKLC